MSTDTPNVEQQIRKAVGQAIEAGADRDEIEAAVSAHTDLFAAEDYLDEMLTQLGEYDATGVTETERSIQSNVVAAEVRIVIDVDAIADQRPVDSSDIDPTTCPECGDTFDTERGRNVHISRVHDRDDDADLDHTDEDDLRRAFREASSINAAAKRFPVGYDAVRKRMVRAGIYEPNEQFDVSEANGEGEPVDDGEGEGDDDEGEDDDDEREVDMSSPQDEAATLVNQYDITRLTALADELDVTPGTARAIAMDADVYSELLDDDVGRPGVRN